MKKIIFPIQKITVKQFVHWQAKGKTAAISLEDVFNHTANLIFEKGFISLITDYDISRQIDESKWERISVYLDDDIYEKLEYFRLKYGDFKFVQFKALIASFVEISCRQAEKIVTETNNP